MEDGSGKDKVILDDPLDIHPLQKVVQVSILSLTVAFCKGTYPLLILSLWVLLYLIISRSVRLILLLVPFLIFILINIIFFFRDTNFLLTSVKILLSTIYALAIFSKGRYHTLRWVAYIFYIFKIKDVARIVFHISRYFKGEDTKPAFNIRQLLLNILIGSVVIL